MLRATSASSAREVSAASSTSSTTNHVNKKSKSSSGKAVAATPNGSSSNSQQIRSTEISLLDIISESLKACALSSWPIVAQDKSRTFESWMDFVFAPRISITCERVKMIELLAAPLLIQHEETQFYELAAYYWSYFQSKEEGGCCIQLGQQRCFWPWQRKLLFIVFCLFSTKRITKLLASTSNDIATMNPRLSGSVFSIIANLRVDGTRTALFYPSPSNTSRYRQKLFGNIMNWWDFEYRAKCGQPQPKAVVLSRYKQQEKFYFLLLAHHAISHHKPQNQCLPLTHSSYLGVLRMMFAVQDTGTREEESSELTGWRKCSAVKRLMELVPALDADLEAIYIQAKIINRLIEKADTTISWMHEQGKHKELMDQVNTVISLVPLHSGYIHNISEAFTLPSKKLPVMTPCATRYLNPQELRDKLVAAWEFQLLCEIEDVKDCCACIVEDQLAVQVHQYYQYMIASVLQQQPPTSFLVRDIFDPETQRPAVLVMLPNTLLYLVQCFSWASHVSRTSTSFDASGLNLMLFTMRGAGHPLELMIMMLRVLLLGQPVERCRDDMVKIHAQRVELILQKYLYKPPMQEAQESRLHAKFTGLAADATVMDYLKRIPGFEVSALFISLLLLPFLSDAKIEKRNAAFFKDTMSYSLKNVVEDEKMRARNRCKERIEKLDIAFPTLILSSDEKAKLDVNYQTLDMKSPASTVLPSGNYADALVMIKRLANTGPASVGTATLLAVLSCVTPVLQVTPEYLASLFPDLQSDTANGRFYQFSAPVAGGVFMPKPGHSDLSNARNDFPVFNCVIRDFFHLRGEMTLSWLGGVYTEQMFRVPITHVEGSSFQQLCFPQFRHSGEVVNPLYSSFLHSMPERSHKQQQQTWLFNWLDEKKEQPSLKRARSSSPPPFNLASPEPDSDEPATPVHVRTSTSHLMDERLNKTFQDFSDEFDL